MKNSKPWKRNSAKREIIERKVTTTKTSEILEMKKLNKSNKKNTIGTITNRLDHGLNTG
jgi:hypothetical protein